MKRIVHLSDLHFGTETNTVMHALVTDIIELKPDVVVISGDFTQRALIRQYRKAEHFLSLLNQEHLICVPGNHDISLHNFFERFFLTFEKYKKFISDDLCPQYVKNNLAILGVNSVTPFKSKGGHISRRQLDYIFDFFEKQNNVVKIAVMHHNLISSERHKIIDNSDGIIDTFAACNVNLILSGHLHYAAVEQLKRASFQHNMYVITAGTAISKRLFVNNGILRQYNSFNVIDIFDKKFILHVRDFNQDRFTLASEAEFPL